jgi:hypothetical protein
MWLTSETDDEYIVRGIPVALWGAGAAFIAVGVGILISNGASFLNWAKPTERPGDTFIVAFGLLFIPATGLSLFFLFPLIITRFNRKQKYIEYAQYRPLWVYRRRISFDQIDGGVHVSEQYDSDSGGNTYRSYFDLKNGERLKMCSEPGSLQGRSYDIAMRLNDILRNEEHYWTDKVPESGEDVITLGLNK